MPVSKSRVGNSEAVHSHEELKKPEPIISKPADALPVGITLDDIRKVKAAARDKMQADSKKTEAKAIEPENLRSAWQQAIDMLTADKKLFGNALRACHISFANDQITVHTDVVGMDFLKGERIRLLDFFKTFYHNENINVLFELKVSDLEQKGEHVLSAREIFEIMAAKNPNLRILKDKLGMDMEY